MPLRHRAASSPFLTASAVALLAAASTEAQEPRAAMDSMAVERGDSVRVRLVDAELRAALHVMSRYLDRPFVLGAVPPGRVTFETPMPVPRAEVPRLVRGMLAGHNLVLTLDSASGVYRVLPVDSPPAPPGVTPAALNVPPGTPTLHVVRLRHAKAADVAGIVNALYGRAAAVGEIGARPNTLADQLRMNQVPAQGPPRPAAVPGVAGTGAALTGETTIVPDPGSNSLLIRANATDFALLQAAIQELDVRPLQVLIEVLIAEVRRDRSLAFGVETAVPTSRVPRVEGATASVSTTGLGLGDFVMRVMRTGPGLDLDATIRAAAARGDARIVSRPVVIAANGEPASILVGSQRPFVQVSRSLPTDAPQRDQVVQYKEVGTRLAVRPTISRDGYVMLEVTQEVNAATAETQFDAPVISTRTVETRLLVRDSQTVVLGGLSDRQGERSQSGVPLLSSIPLIGGLFGRASRRNTETEFFLFITPRVLRTDDEADRATTPFRDRSDAQRELQEEKRP